MVQNLPVLIVIIRGQRRELKMSKKKKRSLKGLRKHLKMSIILLDLEPFSSDTAICGSVHHTGEYETKTYKKERYIKKGTGEIIDSRTYNQKYTYWYDYDGYGTVSRTREERDLLKLKGEALYRKEEYDYYYEVPVVSALFATKFSEMDCKKCYWFLFRKGLIDEKKHAEWAEMGMLNERFARWERWSDIK